MLPRTYRIVFSPSAVVTVISARSVRPMMRPEEAGARRGGGGRVGRGVPSQVGRRDERLVVAEAESGATPPGRRPLASAGAAGCGRLSGVARRRGDPGADREGEGEGSDADEEPGRSKVHRDVHRSVLPTRPAGRRRSDIRRGARPVTGSAGRTMRRRPTLPLPARDGRM